MKKIDVEISQNILRKLKSEKLAKLLSENFYSSGIDIHERKRVRIQVENNIYEDIKKLKAETKQPMWRIVEKILGDCIKEKEIVEVENKSLPHIEPDNCPECRSGDLLISHANYTWYCHECESNGEY